MNWRVEKVVNEYLKLDGNGEKMQFYAIIVDNLNLLRQ